MARSPNHLQPPQHRRLTPRLSESGGTSVVSEVMEHLSSIDSENSLEDIDSHSVLDELQNIIVQGAADSRYFWPSNDAHEARGRELREMFRVTEDSPLRSRSLRNMIEHFDEKLDHYLAKGIVGHVIPSVSGILCKAVIVNRSKERLLWPRSGNRASSPAPFRLTLFLHCSGVLQSRRFTGIDLIQFERERQFWIVIIWR